MNWEMYARLSVMTLLQFAIWGAWSPVLAARLFGPLKFTGKQVGWIYGTMYLGCIVSPLIVGMIVDRLFASQWVLAATHAAGGVLLLVAARRGTFRGLFAVMLLYALAFAPTIAVVTSLTFRQLEDKAVGAPFFAVSVWGVVGWVLVGWLLTAWRRAKGAGDGSDCLVLAGVLSLVMAAYCLSLPDTQPKAKDPLTKALSLLSNPDFVIFLVVSLVVAAQLQFYFLGTAPFLGELGVEGKNMPAVMSIAQAAQVAATLLVAIYEKEVLGALGFRWAIGAGAAMWLAMYCVYALTQPRWLVIASQALHGVAYTFFIGVGFVCVKHFADQVKEATGQDFLASANSLYTVVLYGFGLFLGTRFTGVVMDRLRAEGKFRWRQIFLVPCALLLACAVLFTALFRGPAYKPTSGEAKPPAAAEAPKTEKGK